MPLKDADKRTYVGELQSLQRQINFLKEVKKRNPEASLEKTIDILRNSQDKLYSALSYHGVTAEQVHTIIIENSDKSIVSEIMKLQQNKDKINKQLTEPNLSPEKRQLLEANLDHASQAHKDVWSEVINSPDKDRIMAKIQQAQIKTLKKEQTREKEREHERGR